MLKEDDVDLFIRVWNKYNSLPTSSLERVDNTNYYLGKFSEFWRLSHVLILLLHFFIMLASYSAMISMDFAAFMPDNALPETANALAGAAMSVLGAVMGSVSVFTLAILNVNDTVRLYSKFKTIKARYLTWFLQIKFNFQARIFAFVYKRDEALNMAFWASSAYLLLRESSVYKDDKEMMYHSFVAILPIFSTFDLTERSEQFFDIDPSVQRYIAENTDIAVPIKKKAVQGIVSPTLELMLAAELGPLADVSHLSAEEQALYRLSC